MRWTFALCAAVGLVAACGGDDLDPDTSDESTAAVEDGGADGPEIDRGAYTAVYRFTGRVDSETGTFEISPAVRTFDDPAATRTGLRTVRSASYCDLTIVQDGIAGSGPADTVELYTPEGSIASSLPGEPAPAACTGPGIASGLFPIDGVFCAEVVFESFFGDDLSDVYAVIESFGGTFGTNGAYLFPQGSGAEAPSGEGAPEGELGIWHYGETVAPETPVTRVWTFRNQSAAAYDFSGAVYASYDEVCGDDIDNDCDGRVDEGCNEFALGVVCVEDADCASAACDEVTNRCAPGTCGNGIRDGAETDVDCGGGCAGCEVDELCGDNDDCDSGICREVAGDSICRSTASPDSAGDLVISEYMADPGAGEAEWFEIYNPSAIALDLENCLVVEAASSRVIAASYIIEPGSYFVITDDAASPAIDLLDASDYAVVPMALNNGAESLAIHCGGVEIDAIAWDVAELDVVTTARSTQVDSRSLDADDNDDNRNFCDGTDAYGSFFGTPGTANNPCTDYDIDFCRYQFPTTRPGPYPAESTATVYGRVYVEGLTDADRSNNPARRLIAQAGLGAVGTDPATAGGWDWFDLEPNDPYTAPDTPLERNNDEYFGTIDIPASVGTTYDGAIRFSGDNGGTWVYCDRDGSTDGYEPADVPQFEVTAPVGSPDTVGDIVFSEVMINGAGAAEDSEFVELYNASAETLDLRDCVLSEDADITIDSSLVLAPGEFGVIAVSSVAADNGGVPYDILMPTLSISNSGEDMALICDGVTIDAVSFPSGVDVDGESIQLHPDHYDAARNDTTEAFGPSTVLTYWCNTPHTENYGTVGAQTVYGTPGAANVECFDVSYCRVDTPGELLGVATSSTNDVRGQVYAEGVTDQSTGVELHHMVRAQVGIGDDGTDPSSHPSWTWTNADSVAAWNGAAVGEPNNDGYIGGIVAPAAEEEERDYAYRFSGDRGETWLYCDRVVGGSDASADGYQAANAGRLTTPASFSVDWCTLGGISPHIADAGTSHDLYVEAYIPGFTDVTPGVPDAQPASVLVEFGYGPDGTDPATWTWQDGTINYGNGNNDGWRFDLAIPAVDVDAGTATTRWAARISGDAGGTWQNCDFTSGNFPTFAAADAGSMTGNTWGITWAYHQWPLAPIAVDPGGPATYYGRVRINGLTNRSANVDTNPNALAQIGYGDLDSDPSTDPSWEWTTAAPTPGYNHFSGEVDYDEYRGILEPSRPGTWSVTWRFSGDGGQTWFYADRGGAWDGAGETQTLTVNSPVIFFSEYVEGSGFNKAVELYVHAGSGVDFDALGCELRRYSNGSASVSGTSVLPSTSLDAGDVFVFCLDNAGNTVPNCDDSGTAANFNGDDAVALFCTELGGFVDVIGQIGVDPGSEWGSGATSTANNTIRRDCSVTEGDANGADAFNPAAEWIGFASDTFDDVGQHVCP